jgi:GrpB-like predicted nucleotidyltransferase (UPF0157 family)
MGVIDRYVLVKLHHSGSTSVPGMSAKPIIDLMPAVTNLTDLDRRQSLVTALGFEWHGELGITGRRYCTRSDEIGKRSRPASFFQADSPEIVRQLAFRDYLRAHHDVARAYEKKSTAPVASIPAIPTPTRMQKMPGFGT